MEAFVGMGMGMGTGTGSGGKFLVAFIILLLSGCGFNSLSAREAFPDSVRFAYVDQFMHFKNQPAMGFAGPQRGWFLNPEMEEQATGKAWSGKLLLLGLGSMGGGMAEGAPTFLDEHFELTDDLKATKKEEVDCVVLAQLLTVFHEDDTAETSLELYLYDPRSQKYKGRIVAKKWNEKIDPQTTPMPKLLPVLLKYRKSK